MQLSDLPYQISAAKNPHALFVFAHGAGANMDHGFMQQVSALLVAQNITVVRFNFTYMQKREIDGKRYPPDRMPKLLDAYQQVVNSLLACDLGLPLFIGGKSMGSRVAATLAGDHEISKVIDGVFCLGYPFHPTKKPEKLRLTPLQNTLKPIVVVQGERDTLGSQVEILDYKVSNLCHCVFLVDGDHSLKPRVKSGFTHQQHMAQAVDIITTFIQGKINHD